MAGKQSDNMVTYEAADRGASCCLGCWATTMMIAGAGVLLWYVAGGSWKLIVGGVLILAGAGLFLFMRSSRRGRWEVTFDSDRREVLISSSSQGTYVERAIPFQEIVAVELEQITRDVSTGDDVAFLRPVLHLESGEQVEFDERLSVKSPSRAEEVVEEMRNIVGLRDARS